MGKVTTIYIPDSMAEVWKAFEDIAHREKGRRGTSEMLMEVVADHVKKHGEGNKQYDLDHTVVAYPTIWEDWTPEKVAGLTEKEKEEMRTQIAKNSVLLEPIAVKPTSKKENIITRSPRCDYCGNPMTYGSDSHYYSNRACAEKARADKKYDGPVSIY